MRKCSTVLDMPSVRMISLRVVITYKRTKKGICVLGMDVVWCVFGHIVVHCF